MSLVTASLKALRFGKWYQPSTKTTPSSSKLHHPRRLSILSPSKKKSKQHAKRPKIIAAAAELMSHQFWRRASAGDVKEGGEGGEGDGTSGSAAVEAEKQPEEVEDIFASALAFPFRDGTDADADNDITSADDTPHVETDVESGIPADEWAKQTLQEVENTFASAVNESQSVDHTRNDTLRETHLSTSAHTFPSLDDDDDTACGATIPDDTSHPPT
ncbi:hypothetical protein HK104_005982, partial [Borealophlyctis nickersoniae]